MEPLPPCYTASLFRPLLNELLTLLEGLHAADWDRPTIARGWRVRDVAAHLLDGDLRKLAACRDGHRLPLVVPEEITENAENTEHTERALVHAINAMNATGVAYAARLSNRLLIDLLETTGAWVADFVLALPPHEPAVFAVSWAGESTSHNWMDTGREYTERWHHQMQIRDAIGAPLLLQPRWMEPLLDLSIRALPHAYAAVAAPPGAIVTLAVHGETHGVWSLVRDTEGWTVSRGRPAAPDAEVSMSADVAWRLLYNALPAEDVPRVIRASGAPELLEPLWRARSVMV
jgi:hypothetical protein